MEDISLQKKYNLFLDDIREPNYQNVNGFITVVAHSYSEAVAIIEEKGCPAFISFDHDLGMEKSGFDLAKYLVEKDMDENGAFLDKNFFYFVHSANQVGRKNIEGLLDGYLNHKNKNRLSLK